MKAEEIDIFTPSAALQWCVEHAAATSKRPFRQALLRLTDVYEHGRVSSSHLTIHGDLSDDFADSLSAFIQSLPSQGFIESSLLRYREACAMFFRFCQIYGICSLHEINFMILEKYHAFIVESKEYEDYEGCAERMLLYFAETHGLKYGYSLYLHYARTGKCTSADDLSQSSRRAMETIRRNCLSIPANEFYRSLPGFVEKLKLFGYSQNVLHGHSYRLNVLYIFLEREGLGYSREIADLWASDLSARLFGSGRVKAFTHTLDLYDAYILNSHVVPKAVHAPRKSAYAALPDWCKTEIDGFARARLKEGLREVTVRKQIHACAKFCCFIQSEGIGSFRELNPETIKRFNLWDTHHSASGKNNTNQAVCKFLVHMEMHGNVQSGLHNALPHCTAYVERIIKVMSDEDKERLDSYCSRANTPIELRDAAMLKLGANTAMRGDDIVSLKLSDIDWKSRCIRVVQSKTGAPHMHPVDNGTLNAVFRYIRDGRSKKAESDRVFISVKAPYTPLSGSESCRQAMRHAGLSVCDFHRLRRNYATESLKSGATFYEAAELLGHSGTQTIQRYALLDEERMRLCPLSLEETGLSLEGRYIYGQ